MLAKRFSSREFSLHYKRDRILELGDVRSVYRTSASSCHSSIVIFSQSLHSLLGDRLLVRRKS